MGNRIFTNQHSEWDQFGSKLFHLVYAHNDGIETGNCSDDFRHTRKLLDLIPGIDVEGSIANFKEMYGCKCDCTLARIIN